MESDTAFVYVEPKMGSIFGCEGGLDKFARFNILTEKGKQPNM